MSKFIKILLLFVLLGIFGITSATFALEIQWPSSPAGTQLTDESGITELIQYLYEWGIALGGLAAFFALVIAGFQYLTSAGDPGKMKAAKDRIISAVLGLVLLLSTFIILNTINPELTTLSPPTTDIGELGTKIWETPEWAQPCEWVEVYKETKYRTLHTRADEDDFDICKATGGEGWGGIGDWADPVNSIRIKGACQVNLYDWSDCTGNYVAIGKSMPNLEWIGLDRIHAVKIFDVTPPVPPEVETVGVTSGPRETPGTTTWEVELKGELIDMGRADVVWEFFEYGESDIYLDKIAPEDIREKEVFEEGDFTCTIKNLEASKTYYYRAGAKNMAGTSFGEKGGEADPFKSFNTE